MCGHFCLIKKSQGGRKLDRVAYILSIKDFLHIVYIFESPFESHLFKKSILSWQDEPPSSVWRLEPRVLHMLAKCCTIQLHL